MNPAPACNRRTLLAAGLAAAAIGARSQDAFPSRTIRIVAPSAAGGPTDVIARLLADRLSPVFKVPMVVENRPGAVGAIALAAVAKAPPDGHTLLVSFLSASVIHPLLNPKLPYDARKDFTPITQVFAGASTLMAHPSLPANTLPEFIAWARTQSPPVAYGSFGTGSAAHLSGEYLQMLTGIRMTHVPYKSATALVNDMVGGHVLLGFLDSTNAVAQLRAQRLKGLAQTGSARGPSMPTVPTMAEQGVNFTIGAAWNGVFGPANLPAPVVERLNREIVRFLREPDVREFMLKTVGQAPAPTTAAEFAQMVRNDFSVYQQVIEKAGITLDEAGAPR
ncbi:MAG TPA: tripartite tricarboxylate transporter substrate binding protein [Ramlibacter sp.]|nr:tripartite tricarboxylate transporter substrate binding protein [Ramlibacter sp.]